MCPENALKVLINDDPMVTHQSTSFMIIANLQEGNTVHTYELIGSKSIRKTQNNNLIQKLEAMNKS